MDVLDKIFLASLGLFILSLLFVEEEKYEWHILFGAIFSVMFLIQIIRYFPLIKMEK